MLFFFSGVMGADRCEPMSPAYLLSRHMDTGSSTVFLRQAPSQGAWQIRPRTDGIGISCITTSSASSTFPSSNNLFILGMSIWAGQASWQGAWQSPVWSLSNNSRAAFLASITSSSPAAISIPSSAFTVQEASICPSDLFFTMQTIQEAK